MSLPTKYQRDEISRLDKSSDVIIGSVDPSELSDWDTDCDYPCFRKRNVQDQGTVRTFDKNLSPLQKSKSDSAAWKKHDHPYM